MVVVPGLPAFALTEAGLAAAENSLEGVAGTMHALCALLNSACTV